MDSLITVSIYPQQHNRSSYFFADGYAELNAVIVRSFPKNVCLVAVDSGNIVKQQPVTRKDRVSCEVNSIGATGAKPPLLERTTMCIGTRTGQPVLSYTINGSDYAGLPSSLLWPYQIVTTVDGQIQKEKMRKLLSNCIMIPFYSFKDQRAEKWQDLIGFTCFW